MSKNLAKLLAVDEAGLAMIIAKLEEQSGFPSEDVRILAENKHQVRRKIEQLGLDANDTTDKELYYGLRARFERDSQMLDKALGANEHTKLHERLNKAIQLVNHCASTDDVWVVKNSVAKSALSKYPPKRVAHQLHYRSVASLIKREDTADIYLAATLLESVTWQKNIAKHLSKLNASHYELRPIKTVNLQPEKWQDVDESASHVVIDKHSGSVAIWPADDLNRTSVLTLTLLLLSGIQALNPIGYSEALHELSPALRWWADSMHLISARRQPVSFNLKDVALNHLRGHELTEAIRHHGVHSLWNELTGRYQRASETLSDNISALQTNLDYTASLKLPSSAELVEEYAKAER
jgi:hypothetical protein